MALINPHFVLAAHKGHKGKLAKHHCPQPKPLGPFVEAPDSSSVIRLSQQLIAVLEEKLSGKNGRIVLEIKNELLCIFASRTFISSLCIVL